MTKKTIFTLSVLIMSVLFIFACGGKKEDHSKHDHGKHEMSEHKEMATELITQTLESAELKIGDKTICPVMNSKFTVKENTKFATVNGKKIYVCCPSCVAPIEKNPEKYLKK